MLLDGPTEKENYKHLQCILVRALRNCAHILAKNKAVYTTLNVFDGCKQQMKTCRDANFRPVTLIFIRQVSEGRREGKRRLKREDDEGKGER